MVVLKMGRKEKGEEKGRGGKEKKKERRLK